MTHKVSEIWHKIKAVLTGELFTVLLIVFIGLASFGLGRLSSEEGGRVPLQIRYPEQLESSAGATSGSALTADTDHTAAAAAAGGGFVGSKNSDKYHFPWCSGAQRIKEENKITFATRAEAEAAGYTPAGNCPGL